MTEPSKKEIEEHEKRLKQNNGISISTMENFKIALDSSVNLMSRTIYLWDEISECNADTVSKAVHELERLDPKAPICVHISTFGGDVYSMFGIYDTLKSSKCPIKVVASGMVMSAGILITIAGDPGMRFAQPNTQFMFHKGSFEIADEHANAVATVNHYEDIKDRMIKLIAKNSAKPLNFWKKLEKESTDIYFDANRAKKYGVIDEVVKLKRKKKSKK
jgi:ATP-dependent Clp protease protease subunit